MVLARSHSSLLHKCVMTAAESDVCIIYCSKVSVMTASFTAAWECDGPVRRPCDAAEADDVPPCKCSSLEGRDRGLGEPGKRLNGIRYIYYDTQSQSLILGEGAWRQMQSTRILLHPNHIFHRNNLRISIWTNCFSQSSGCIQ